MWERRRDSEDKKRLLTSGYETHCNSAGMEGWGVGGLLFVSEDVFPQMQRLCAAVYERAMRVNVCVFL